MKKIAKKISRALSLILIIESDTAIREGNRNKAIGTTIAGTVLNAVDFYDSLKSISEKEFTDEEREKGTDDLYYFRKVINDLTLMPIINSYLIASSIKSISRMK